MNDICNKQTEVYSRVVGFYRPVNSYNPGKKEEFKQRKVYKIDQENNVDINDSGIQKTN